MKQYSHLCNRRLVSSLLFVYAMLCPAVLMAEDGNQVLQIWQTDGQVVTLDLKDEPRTTYNNGSLVITTKKSTVTYPLEKVRKYTYASVADGITSPTMKASFSKDGETLTFTGLKPQASVVLYTASGQQLRKKVAAQNGRAVISVSGLPVGVYVVKANDVTYKMTKR